MADNCPGSKLIHLRTPVYDAIKNIFIYSISRYIISLFKKLATQGPVYL